MGAPLDTRAVELKGRELLKAIEASAGSPALLSILSELRSGVTASEQVLRSTKIGVTVNKLKQHKDPSVGRAASELVSKWRTDISKNRASGTSTPRAQIGSPAPGKGLGQKSSGLPNVDLVSKKLEKEKASVVIPPREKRSAKEDKTDCKVTGSDTRDACVRLVYDGLVYMSDYHPDDVLRIAIAVESAASTGFPPEGSQKYREKIRSLFLNFKSNVQLRQGVFTGEIAPAKLVKMTSEELRSAERKAEDAKMMKENMKEAMVAREEKSISTQLQCSKCGQRKVSYTQAQTRSADEPMTTFCECLVCGKRWKFS